MFGGVAGYRPRVQSVYYKRVYFHSPEEQVIFRGAAQKSQGVRCLGGVFYFFYRSRIKILYYQLLTGRN